MKALAKTVMLMSADEARELLLKQIEGDGPHRASCLRAIND